MYNVVMIVVFFTFVINPHDFPYVAPAIILMMVIILMTSLDS